MEEYEIEKVRFLYWQAVIPYKNSIYFLPAYTKKGAIRRANEFLKEGPK